jgi:copper(I)-binding protein
VTSTSRRRVIAVAALLAAAPALAACGAGDNANTNQPYAPTESQVLIRDSVYGERGMRISQAFVLGPDSGGQIPAGGAAPLYLILTNENPAPDSLASITPLPDQATSVKVAAPVQVPPHTLVNTGQPTPQITVEGLKNALRGGETLTLTLKFQSAGDITLDVPVITRSREFATLPPVTGAIPAPSPTASASPTAATGH